MSETIPVAAIDHENDRVCIGKVVPPQWSDFVFATDVPRYERDVFEFDILNIKSDRETVSATCSTLHLVEDCGLTGVIETDDNDRS